MPEILRFYKQPDETLDYEFDFTAWMPATDHISSAVVTVSDPSLTLGTMTTEGNPVTIVRQFISGGTDGMTYQVTCSITTNQGRTKEADILLQVSEV